MGGPCLWHREAPGDLGGCPPTSRLCPSPDSPHHQRNSPSMPQPSLGAKEGSPGSGHARGEGEVVTGPPTWLSSPAHGASSALMLGLALSEEPCLWNQGASDAALRALASGVRGTWQPFKGCLRSGRGASSN